MAWLGAEGKGERQLWWWRIGKEERELNVAEGWWGVEADHVLQRGEANEGLVPVQKA